MEKEEVWFGLFVIFVIVLILAILIGLFFAFPAYSRYQARLNAQNQVVLNETRIKQTAQLVEVEKQRAQIKVQEAEGIAAAQHIINATLTDRYLQHEAIIAQEQMANSPNHTQIYIPVGTNGIPLVKTVGPSE